LSEEARDEPRTRCSNDRSYALYSRQSAHAINPSPLRAAPVAAALPEVVARISNAFPSAASDAHAEQVLPLPLLVAVAEAAATCGDREEAYLYVPALPASLSPYSSVWCSRI